MTVDTIEEVKSLQVYTCKYAKYAYADDPETNKLRYRYRIVRESGFKDFDLASMDLAGDWLDEKYRTVIRKGKKMRVKLLADLKSGDETVPAGTILRVIVGNEQGWRATDARGGIHVINNADAEVLDTDGAYVVPLEEQNNLAGPQV